MFANEYAINDRIYLLTCGDKINAIRKHRKKSIHIRAYTTILNAITISIKHRTSYTAHYAFTIGLL
jgi:hypothetical protein